MSLDVGRFISSASRSISSRATSTIDNNLGGNGIAGLAASVFSSGASGQTVRSLASMRFDQLVNQASNDFFSRIRGTLTGQSQNRLPAGTTNADTQSLLTSNTATTPLKFPHDLGPYCFGLQFAKYRRPVPLASSTTEITKTIYLPLPRELVGGHNMNYSTPETGILGTAVDAAVLANERGGTTGTAVSAGIVAAIGVGGGLLASSANLMAAVGIGGDEARAMIEQTGGAVMNPNLSVSYRGPTLRTYEFNWEFSPTNAQESQTIQQIITEIQKRSLAAFSVENSSALLSYPEMALVKLLPNGPGQIGDLMQFKKSMISSVNINYAPNGIPSFFKGTKAPTFIALTLSFQEIEYFVSKDYGGTNAGEFSQDFEAIRGYAESTLGMNFSANPTAPSTSPVVNGALNTATAGGAAQGIENPPEEPH